MPIRPVDPAKQREIWSGPRLALVLGYFFQGSHRAVHHVDAKIVGAAVGVTAGTVRRWAREGLPLRRLEAFEGKILPAPIALEQDHRELSYARAAVDEINDRSRSINPAWKEQRWLEPHSLGIVRFEHLGICVPRLSRADGESKTSARARAGSGVVIEEYLFGNRLSAQVAKGELLEALLPWRLVLPPGIIDRGRTEAWLEDAPMPKLPWMALTRASVRRS